MVPNFYKPLFRKALSLLLLLCIGTTASRGQGPGGVSTGLKLWLDGSNVLNNGGVNPANGTSIATWKDISGNGNDATILAGQNTPAMNTSQINGKDVVKFTRTSNTLGTVYKVAGIDIRATTLPQVTIFTVYRQGTRAAGEWHGIWGDDDGGWDRFFMPTFGTADGIVSVGPPTNNVPVTNAGVTGATKLLTAVYDYGVANGSTIYFNALPVQSVTDNTNTTAAQTNFRIGFDGDDNPYNGDIAEIILYNRKLTDCEIKAVNRYLGYKYGVTLTTATISPSPRAYYCTGSSSNVTLTGSSSTAGATFQWLQNGAIIPAATSSTYAASTYGNYQVVATVGGCPDTSAITTVYPVGSTIYVDSSVATSGSGTSWASPLKTVAEALTMANSISCSVSIWVKKGTYYPTSGTVRDSSLRILRNNIKLYGGFAGTETALTQRNISLNTTTLSADIGVINDSTDNSYHVLAISAIAPVVIDTNTTVDGFTIRSGKADSNSNFTYNGVGLGRNAGGGIYITVHNTGAQNSPLITNCTFDRNNANYGGGLYNVGSPTTNTAIIRSCAFTNNNAVTFGGAMDNNNANATITNCTFTGNSCPYAGGALLHEGSTSVLTLSGCTFTSNITQAFGAAIVNTFGCSMSVSNCTFNSNLNTANGSGAAIYGQNAGYVNVSNSTFQSNRAGIGAGIMNNGNPSTVTSCTFKDNVSTNNVGGGIYSGFDLTLSNSLFQRDTATGGGGVYIGAGTFISKKNVFISNVSTSGGGGGLTASGSTDTIANNLFVFNKDLSGTGGAGLYLANGTNNVDNCTFYADTATTGPGGGLRIAGTGIFVVSNNIFYRNGATTGADINNASGGTYTPSNNLLNTDPQFTNPSNPIGVDGIWGTTDDGLRLTPCSPAINAGSNALVPAGLTTDLTAATRIQNTTVEMGAYEMPYNPTGLPSTTIAMSPANPVCAATSITFTATTVAPGASPSYQWYKNNTLIGGATAATYTSSAWSNNDSIWVIHTNNDCNLKDTSNKLYIIVTPVPATPGTISGPISPCVTTAQTYSIASVGAATTYTWTVPSGWTITSGNGTATLNTTVGSAGNITVTAGNVCGTSAAQSLAVTPNAIPATPSAISGNASPCIGSSGIYSVSPITNATSYNWVVPSGWTMTAGAATPSMTTTVGSTAGNITVSATNACGTSPIQPLAVTPISNVTPSVSITANPGVSICANTSVTFTPTPVNGGTTPTYQWKKNGVNVATGSTYTTTGLVNGDQVSVVMTTSLSCFTTPTASSNTLTFTVTSIPATPGTITGNTSVCNGSSQQYSIVSVSGATNYTWTLPSGWTGGNTGPSVLATAGAGSGNITVTANNLCGASAPASLAVTATSIPATPAAITGSATPCANTSQTYSVAAVSGATAYNWSLPSGWAGTSTTNNITLTTGTTGGSLQVSAANLCGASAPSTLAVIPVNIPATPAAISGSATPCSGVATTYSVSAVSGATSYLWNIPIGWAGASSTPSISLTPTTTAGTLQVSSVGVCGTSAPRTLSISPIPSVTPSVSVSIPSSSICQFTAATFTAVPVNGGAAPLYQWKKNGINTGVNSSASTYSDPLLATGDVISVVMTSNATCATSATAAATNPITMTVIPQVVPGININAIPPIVLCAGTPITFTTNITGGGSSPFYQWYKNNNAIGGANGPTYTTTTLANADSLSVRLTSNAVCRSMDSVMSNKAGVTVNPIVNPAVSISANPGTSGLAPGTYVTFTATYSGGGSNPTFQWKKNGVVIGTAGGASYGVYFTGTNAGLKGGDLISVVMSSYDPCAASPIVSSNVLRMDNPTGIAAVGNWEGTISLYPNPNSGHFTIGADWGSGHSGQRVSAELINALGQVVYTTEVIPNTNQWTIEVWLNESVANGIYQLKLTTNNMKLVKPVMIQR